MPQPVREGAGEHQSMAGVHGSGLGTDLASAVAFGATNWICRCPEDGHVSTRRGIAMKTAGKLVVVLLVALAIPSASFGGSGWFSQTPPRTTPSILTGVATPDPNTIVAVGTYGTIVRSSDSGATWTLQSSGTTGNLWAVAFWDANTGIAVGNNGTILRTSDGGLTWTPQSSGTDRILLGVSLV